MVAPTVDFVPGDFVPFLVSGDERRGDGGGVAWFGR